MTRQLVIEADGGSRGNPGPAGYGALVRDPGTGEVLAEESEFLGRATNNVAEYSGLIAGLRAAARLAPGADVEVRMDSKLVVEQMSGRWRIRHPDLRPLAADAARVARTLGRVRYTWVPRVRNAHADRLANEAMDAGARGRPPGRARGGGGPAREGTGGGPGPARRAREAGDDADGPAAGAGRPGEERSGAPGRGAQARTGPGWTQFQGTPVTTVLLRHGETPLSAERRFAGRVDIPLTETGLRQARAAAERLAARGGIEAIITSPLRRTRRTAEAVAAATGAPVTVQDAWIETDFGDWEGLTYAEVGERWPEEMATWLTDPDVAPPGGESFTATAGRVLPALGAVLAGHPAGTVVIVSHVTPLKILLSHALLAPPIALRRMHLDVASLCEADWYTDGSAVVRSLNDTAHLWEREWGLAALC